MPKSWFPAIFFAYFYSFIFVFKSLPLQSNLWRNLSENKCSNLLLGFIDCVLEDLQPSVTGKEMNEQTQKKKKKENWRMNKWRRTRNSPYQSDLNILRENRFVKKEYDMFGKRRIVNIIFTITVIWSVHLENNSQVISLNFVWIRQFLHGSVKCQTSFSLTNFRNVAPWFQAVNHPSLCQPSVSSAPSVSEIRWRRAGQAF